jgi:hypothetical protein
MSLSSLNAGHQTSSVRTLKVLVAVLVVSNLLTGLLSVYVLRKVDERYSHLITQSAPVMNDLQTLTATATWAMRRTDPFFFGPQPEKIAAATKSAQGAIDDDKNLRSALMKKEWIPSTESKREEVASAGQEFTVLAGKVVSLFSSRRDAEAVRVRESELRPAFERYQAVTTQVADVLLDETKRLSEDYSSETRFSSRLMLSIASWPVLLGAALLLATLVFVVSLLILFRVRESAD